MYTFFYKEIWKHPQDILSEKAKYRAVCTGGQIYTGGHVRMFGATKPPKPEALSLIVCDTTSAFPNKVLIARQIQGWRRGHPRDFSSPPIPRSLLGKGEEATETKGSLECSRT